MIHTLSVRTTSRTEMVDITGRVLGSFFDPDRQVHEVTSNLLELPGQEKGFIKSKDIPCHWLPHTAGIPTCIDVGYLRGDDAMPFQAMRGRMRGHNARR